MYVVGGRAGPTLMHVTRLYGQIILPGGDLRVLARRLAEGNVGTRERASCHYAGTYLLVRVGDAEVRIERISDGEFLLHADHGEPALGSLAAVLSAALTAGRVRHRIELYEGENLVHYLHHEWSNVRP